MNIYNSFIETADSLKKPIITWGVFDGVHKGHQLIIKTLLTSAVEDKTDSLLLTFSNHPRSFITGRYTPFVISPQHRLYLFNKFSVQNCLLLPFDELFLKYTAIDFVSFLKDSLDVSAIVFGYNTMFGNDRQHHSAISHIIQKKLGIKTYHCEPVNFEGVPISSSRVRSNIMQGNIETVKNLLGYGISLFGAVVQGEGRGRQLGFPTANIDVHNELLPPNGIYIVKIHHNSDVYFGLANIGIRPTFTETDKQSRVSVEVYIHDFNQNIYGCSLFVELLSYIRPELKFGSSDALINQMNDDLERLRHFIALN